MLFLPSLQPVAPIQTFGDLLGASPHLHILAADGGFGSSGMFYSAQDNINAEEL